jgi:aerobic carbon-monoxide dehydrogenase small subunit
MTSVGMTINGQRAQVEVQPRTSLADLLRERMRLTGTHLGCEHGVCGACTVLVDGIPVRSCIVLAVACEGRDVRPIEGFEDDALMEELRQAFRREHALQCGFCTPGMLIAARDIVMRIPNADEKRIRRELAGNLCRCTGYIGIIKAVHSVVRARAGHQGETASELVRETAAIPPAHKPAQASSSVQPVSKGWPSSTRATAAPSSAPASVPEGAGARAGWTRFAERFVIADDPATVWKILSDFPFVASCLPGAELTEHDERHIKGRMTVKLGPMRAAFGGSANVELDDANRSGRIRGAGSDSGSGSRTRAEATYRVEPNPAGPGSLVSLAVEYNLQGPLAQFSRSGLAQDLGRRLVSEFSANLNNRLAGRQQHASTDQVAPLDAGGMLTAVMSQWFRRLLLRFKRGG